MGKRKTSDQLIKRIESSDAMSLVCTAAEAGELLRVTQERVNQLCLDKSLIAKRPGRDWIISLRSVLEFAAGPRKPGPNQPPKPARRKKT